MKQINFSVNIPVIFIKESKFYIAHSPVLDLSTSADTFEKAQKRFPEVVKIFFEELVEMGTLEEVLTGLGWEKVKSKWTPPVQIGHDIQNISVPLSA